MVYLQEQHSERDPLDRLNELSLEGQSSLLNPLSTLEEASGCVGGESESMDNNKGDSSLNESTPEDEVTASLRKRNYVISELVETEKDYVRDLKEIVDGYMAILRDPNSDIPMPEDIKGGRDKIIFGNIEAISDWHRE